MTTLGEDLGMFNQPIGASAFFDSKLQKFQDKSASLEALHQKFKGHLTALKSFICQSHELSHDLAEFFADAMDPPKARTQALLLTFRELEETYLPRMEYLYENEIFRPMEAMIASTQRTKKKTEYRQKMLEKQALLGKTSMNSNTLANRRSARRRVSLGVGAVMDSIGSLRNKRGTLDKYSSQFGESRQNNYTNVKAVGSNTAATERITTEIVAEFDAFEHERLSGVLLWGPMSSALTSIFYMSFKSAQNIEKIKAKFSPMKAIEEAFGTMQSWKEPTTESTGLVFGRIVTDMAPPLVCDSISYLKRAAKTKGLFDEQGKPDKVALIVEAYDFQIGGSFSSLIVDGAISPYDVATTLVKYFKSMPKPVISAKVYVDLAKLFREKQNKSKPVTPEEIIAVVQTLPKLSLGLIGMLLNFLYDIQEMEFENGCSASRLAAAWAPALISPPVGVDADKLHLNGTGIITVLIQNARKFFVPRASQVKGNTRLTAEAREKIDFDMAEQKAQELGHAKRGADVKSVDSNSLSGHSSRGQLPNASNNSFELLNNGPPLPSRMKPASSETAGRINSYEVSSLSAHSSGAMNPTVITSDEEAPLHNTEMTSADPDNDCEFEDLPPPPPPK